MRLRERSEDARRGIRVARDAVHHSLRPVGGGSVQRVTEPLANDVHRYARLKSTIACVWRRSADLALGYSCRRRGQVPLSNDCEAMLLSRRLELLKPPRLAARWGAVGPE